MDYFGTSWTGSHKYLEAEVRGLSLKGKHIGILGLGKAGMSAARWLHGQGSTLTCFDDKPVDLLDEDFVLWCGERQIAIRSLAQKGLCESFDEIDLLVVSPGIPKDHHLVKEATEEGVKTVGELYLAASFWEGPLIGITGTNGKTTTTLLTQHLLEGSGKRAIYGGNIYPPLFDLLHKDDGKTCAVLEISSFQLEYFPLDNVFDLKRPRFICAVCLNVAPDHLDRHKGMENYLKAKERLFSFQDEDCTAVLGIGAEEFKTVAPPVFLKDVTVLKDKAMRLAIPSFHDTFTFDISGWGLLGHHNIQNLAAALVCSCAMGASVRKMEKALSTFRAPSHRLQEVAFEKGIRFIDDSKATNVHAVLKGLEAISGNVILIAGGRAKGEDFSHLAHGLKCLGGRNGHKTNIRSIFLIGEAAQEMSVPLGKLGKELRIVTGNDGQEVMERAVKQAVSVARSGDSIVLSPACASFDLYSSYKERGLSFQKAIKRVIDGARSE